MTLLTELFSNWIGILSFAVIASMLVDGRILCLFVLTKKQVN